MFCLQHSGGKGEINLTGVIRAIIAQLHFSSIIHSRDEVISVVDKKQFSSSGFYMTEPTVKYKMMSMCRPPLGPAASHMYVESWTTEPTDLQPMVLKKKTFLFSCNKSSPESTGVFV